MLYFTLDQTKIIIASASDFMLGLVVFYAVMFAVLPPLSTKSTIVLHFVHAFMWRVYHTFVLGLLLRAQSKSKFIVRHFMKHYYYPEYDSGSGAVAEAFTNWKSIYNLSMCMTYSTFVLLTGLRILTEPTIASFIAFAWKTYSVPQEWLVGNNLLRHTLGFVSTRRPCSCF